MWDRAKDGHVRLYRIWRPIRTRQYQSRTDFPYPKCCLLFSVLSIPIHDRHYWPSSPNHFSVVILQIYILTHTSRLFHGVHHCIPLSILLTSNELFNCIYIRRWDAVIRQCSPLTRLCFAMCHDDTVWSECTQLVSWRCLHNSVTNCEIRIADFISMQDLMFENEQSFMLSYRNALQNRKTLHPNSCTANSSCDVQI